jgi:fatty acyl-CoA reductase
MADKQSVAEFYNGRSIFITGATGFMGKALLEKLLRSCPGIKQVYILIRPKRGKDVSQRLEELLGSTVKFSTSDVTCSNLKYHFSRQFTVHN